MDQLVEYESWILPLCIMSPIFKYKCSENQFITKLTYMTGQIIDESVKYNTMNITNINNFKLILSYKKDTNISIFDDIMGILKSKPIPFSI